ncbi:sulfite oxidase heme-binding subunit YedZ [Hydrogenophaga sp. BPS33]|uniref:sulfite oxidase heme-binding subunit YedZ n=1 Tax=Hydrogenophaga sp. BPS33 TaxID=2651974 RepID=UPI00131FF77F|nr:protein-methionine-sulfoxide reductase heme-binding subunit MsrQ [Hydrogenophaga sp. BPS33]QHE88005.1 sulfoxide reductase heme-binding subunit YedZ [Hydrogenophaga sp. BPS33]
MTSPIQPSASTHLRTASGGGSRIHRWIGHRAAKPVGFVLACLPFVWLVWAALSDQLGANPAEALIRALGDWTLRFLVLVLAITPLRVTAGWPALARLRRMVGLFVFFYACMHLLAYAWFDMEFDLTGIAADVVKRPFILVGFLSWVLLLALAATSFNRAIRALGAARWQWLHRAVYVIAGLAVLHFFWMRAGKNDFAEVAVYAAILSALLGWRVWRRLSR